MKTLPISIIVLVLTISCNRETQQLESLPTEIPALFIEEILENSDIPESTEIAFQDINLDLTGDYDWEEDSIVTIEYTDCSDGALPFIFVEIKPMFLTGEADLMKYIQEKIVYPPQAVLDDVSGMVYIQFVVEKDGSVNDVAVLRGIRHDLDSACIKVVESMPLWKPGRQRGIPVAVKFTLPFRFRLANSGSRLPVTLNKLLVLDTLKPHLSGDLETPIDSEESIDQVTDESYQFKLYPNPTTDFVNISVDQVLEDVSYTLVSISGQVVRHGRIDEVTMRLNLSDLPKGFYVVRLFSEANSIDLTKKLVIQ